MIRGGWRTLQNKTYPVRGSALLMMVSIVLSAICHPVLAGTVWTEEGEDFEDGTGEYIEFRSDGITLGYNSSLFENWAELSTGPNAREDHSMSFDPVSGETILFGGLNWTSFVDNTRLNDTWTYDLATDVWTNVTSGVAPFIVGHEMVYDIDHKKMVLFGSGVGAASGTETWTFDPATRIWTNMSPSAAPSRRSGFGMAYDGGQGKTVLFGGQVPGGTQFDDETWTYDLGTNTWENRSPTISPQARGSMEMDYDREAGETVMFGGWYDVYATLDDTWTYNLTTNTWTNRDPETRPSKRCGYALSYDPDTGETVLFGGYNHGTYEKNDTWAYNFSENNWRFIPTEDRPAARFDTDMVYDTANHGIVMFGGDGLGEYHNDTWVYSLKVTSNIGHYISDPMDTGGEAYLGSIEWDAEIPDGALVTGQMRSAKSFTDLSGMDFVGPDGTVSSFYGSGDDTLTDIHDGARWVQYMLILQATDLALKPIVHEVRLNYNLAPNVLVTSPKEDDNWTWTQTIEWLAEDMDGDELTFDILLENDTSLVTLATNLTGHSWEWDTNDTPNGQYRIQVVAKDDNDTIPITVNDTSDWFRIYHNMLPLVILWTPNDHSIIMENSATLLWTGFDDDKDPLTYFIFFDSIDGTTCVAHQDDQIYHAEGLEDGVTYYWTVMANDGISNGTPAPVRQFTVESNKPPYVKLTSPVDNVTVNATNITLSWQGHDLDENDLTYYIFFDEGGGTTLIGHVNTTFFNVSGLKDGATYHWTIIPHDGKLNGTCRSGVFHFTVRLDIPPIAVFAVEPLEGNLTTDFHFTSTSYDPNGRIVSWFWDFGDGAADDKENTSHRYDSIGNFFVTLTVEDDTGLKNASSILVRVEALNRPPIIETTSPDNPVKTKVGKSVDLSVTAHDPDKDHLKYQWSIDGEVVGNGTSFNYRPSKKGEVTIIVEVSDGNSTVSFEWNVTIRPKDTVSGSWFSLNRVILLIALVLAITIIVVIIILRYKRPSAE